MQVPTYNRTVLRSFMAGACVLLGAGACSRPDKAESGSENTAATRFEDTAMSAATQNVPGTGQDRAATDTTIPTSDNTGTGAAAGDTAPARIQSDADTTAKPESDSARITEDTSETSLNQSDTAASAGYAEMARDTSGGADQIDTTGAAVGVDTTDTAMNAGRLRPIEDSTETLGQVTTDTSVTAGIADSANAAIGARGDDTTGNAGRVRPVADSNPKDTTMNAGRVRPIEDTTETMGQVTGDTANVAAISDPAEAAGDAAIAARGDDTTGNAGRIRPPEDSTEMQGNVSSAESASVNAADTADEAPVAAEAGEFDTNARDAEVASEAPTDAVGAAALGGTVTGADAVALMTRQGGQCNVVDPELDEKVRWDMSSTPATLNPCGLGSMNLSKVWTEQR